MNGNGGTVSARLVAREAAKTVMSGPASGVTAAADDAEAGRLRQRHHLRHGRNVDRRCADPRRHAGGLLRADHRLRPADPCADGGCAHASGQGRLDRLGSTRPACCRSGRNRPAPTRADLLRPRRRARRPSPTPTSCSAGSTRRLLAVDRPAPLGHVRATIESGRAAARPLVGRAAAAVLRLANAHMAGAIRMVSLSRGLDPRDFVLFAFGGAGPAACRRHGPRAGIPEVLVPARPGLTNALGCLVADLRQDIVQHDQPAARRARHARRRTRSFGAARARARG